MRGRDRPWSRVHDTTTTLQQFGVRAWADEWVSHRRPFFFCGKSHNTNTQPEPDTSKKAKPGNPRNRRLQGNPRKSKEIQGNTTGVLGFLVFLVFLVLPHGALKVRHRRRHRHSRRRSLFSKLQGSSMPPHMGFIPHGLGGGPAARPDSRALRQPRRVFFQLPAHRGGPSD